MSVSGKDVREALAKNRILLLDDDITIERSDLLRGYMLTLSVQSPDPIYLLIDSGGGQLSGAFRVYDFIRTFNVNVIGIVNGVCGSAAVTILLGCAQRWMTTNSSINIHHVRWRGESPAQFVLDVEAHAKLIAQTIHNEQERMLDIYVTRTKMSRERIVDEIRLGEQFGTIKRYPAAEAKELGFVDKIVERVDLFGRGDKPVAEVPS
jgi:ATP-dependent protease ClpP protease subunit